MDLRPCSHRHRGVVRIRSRDLGRKNWRNHQRMDRDDVNLYGDGSKPFLLVNIKIAGKWMFIPLKIVCICRYWSIAISFYIYIYIYIYIILGCQCFPRFLTQVSWRICYDFYLKDGALTWLVVPRTCDGISNCIVSLVGQNQLVDEQFTSQIQGATRMYQLCEGLSSGKCLKIPSNQPLSWYIYDIWHWTLLK